MSVTSSVRTAPKWSMQQRYADKKKQSGPGPGAYTVPTADQFGKFRSSPKFSMGGSVRESAKRKHDPPGPGAYTPFDPNMSTPKFGFGSSVRGADVRRADSPGPAAYFPRPQSAGPSFSVAGSVRPVGMNRSKMPGPGAYSPVDPNMSTVKFGFGSGKRGNFTAASNKTPGPGTYTLESTLCGSATHPSVPKYSLKPRRPVSAPTTRGPGPGAYSTPSLFP